MDNNNKELPVVTREQFEEVMEAVWSELEYQNSLPRRTGAEASDVAGFLTLGRVYQRRAEDDWADVAGDELALHGLRKLAGIYVRAMAYTGIRKR